MHIRNFWGGAQRAFVSASGKRVNVGGGALGTARPAWLTAAMALVLVFSLQGAEVIPPVPKQYFNDYAGVVTAPTVSRLNQALESFERQSSSQILVAVYPRMQSASSIEDYTFRVAEAWKVGREKRDNGAVLFVFVQDRKMFMQVGYGLEGALPDGLVKTIIDREIGPRFRGGDYEGGLSAGVTAILAAAKGEYQGTGRTVAEGREGRARARSAWPLLLLIILFIIIGRLNRGRHGGTVYRRRGYTHWGGGGWGGGWGGGSGGGGFSGGGGRFGGGGAGGSW